MEEADKKVLQARIAALAGKVNEHKHHQQAHHQAPFQHSPQGRGRWAPYGRGGRLPKFQNRQWVAPDAPTPASPPQQAGINTQVHTLDRDPNPPDGGYLHHRGVGQVNYMNKETYERVARREQERVAKRQQQRLQPRAITGQEVQQSTKMPAPREIQAPEAREIVLQGIRFAVRPDGSKLTRISGELLDPGDLGNALNFADPSTTSSQTPKKAEVAGVEFHRTKNGNLVRALNVSARYSLSSMEVNKFDLLTDVDRGPEFAPKAQCENFTKNGTLSPQHNSSFYQAYHWKRTLRTVAANPPHPTLTNSLGSCAFGPKCRFAHHPDKVAVCKTFLQTGNCAAGDYCDMSHDLTYHRVSACTHFLRGNCTKDACRYPHINIPPSAPVCKPFATLGYCGAGDHCSRRHVLECPDYANYGKCTNSQKCELPHVDRAGAMRKAAQRAAKVGSEDESDLSSGDEDASEQDQPTTVDSDGEDTAMSGTDNRHELTQQHDFIAFS